MGSSWSSIFSATTPLQTKHILDTLLQRLITQVDMRDMYSLAEPSMCREYIVVATSSLQKLFASIRISKDKDGVLLFQKIRGIQDKNPDAPEQQMRCRELAFFFVRVFQIYAAIALTIMDMELPVSDPLIIDDKRWYKQKGVVFVDPKEGLRGFSQMQPHKQGFFNRLFGSSESYLPIGSQGGAQTGGALTDPSTLGRAAGAAAARKNGYWLDPAKAGPYEIFNKYLLIPTQVDKYPEEGKEDSLPYMLLQRSNLDVNPTKFRIGVKQTSLWSFDYSAATAPVAENKSYRVTLDLADDNVSIDLKYEYRPVVGNPIIMSGQLSCIREGDRFNMTLFNVNIDPNSGITAKGTSPRITKVLQTSDFSQDIPILTTAENKEIPQVLELMFKESYKALVPSVSAVEFLSSKGLIQGITGQVPIQGTTITITNPQNYTGGEIPVTYTTRYKYQEQTITINIDTELVIVEKKKSDIGEKQYLVKLDLRKLKTRPDYIINDLNTDKYYIQQEYQTGDIDEDPRFRGTFSTFSTGIDDRKVPTNSKGETIPIYLEKVFKSLVEDTGEEGDVQGQRVGIRYTREGFPEPLDSDRIPETMRIKGIWRALAKDPPVKAHCVARAMQLLNVAAIRGNITHEGFSSICNTKFAYATDGSLPPAGKPITQEYGIQALAMLFVDKLQGGFPQITNTEQFKDFRKRFKLFFERYADNRDIESNQVPDKISDVKELLMPEVCQGHTGDRIQLDMSMISELRSITQGLMNRQASHLSNSMAILFELFDKDAILQGRVEISKYVEVNGIDAVNRIAENARNMLAEYYGDCEKQYKDGLYLLFKKHHSAPGSTQYTSANIGVRANRDAAAPGAPGAPVSGVPAAPTSFISRLFGSR